MNIISTPNCSNNYLEIRDGYWKESRLIGKFCGKERLFNLQADTNRMLVTYVALNVKENKGFKAQFKVICNGELYLNSEGYLASPNYPEHYQPNQHCIWKITVPESYKVALKFLTFDLEDNPGCHFDNVTIQERLPNNSSLKTSFCGTKIPESIVSSTNEITISFKSDGSREKEGFTVKIIPEINECDVSDHGCDQICMNTLGSYKCDCNFGFEIHSNGRSCVDTCGSKLTEPNGTITSPSFPDLYSPNKKCVWEIEAPTNHQIFLNFTHFDMEGNNYINQLCSYDQVNISSHFNNKTILEGSFCGTRKPEMIRSHGNKVRVAFGSDETIQGSGFALIYYADLNECELQNGGCDHYCHNTLNSYRCSCKLGFDLLEDGKTCQRGDCVYDIFATSIGNILSPNYPNNYPMSKRCAWNITTLPGHRIKLSFWHFEIEGIDICYFDNVQIFDGPSSNSIQLGKYCGRKEFFSVSSSSNSLYMTFQTDDNGSSKGFLAKYTTICGGRFSALPSKPQKIYSHPAYGNSTYPNWASCHWTLTAPSGYSVELSFLSFDLETDYECYGDYVEVIDIGQNDMSVVGKFCGSYKPSKIVSNEEVLVIRFRTNYAIVGNGFEIEYQAVPIIDGTDIVYF